MLNLNFISFCLLLYIFTSNFEKKRVCANLYNCCVPLFLSVFLYNYLGNIKLFFYLPLFLSGILISDIYAKVKQENNTLRRAIICEIIAMIFYNILYSRYLSRLHSYVCCVMVGSDIMSPNRFGYYYVSLVFPLRFLELLVLVCILYTITLLS